MMRRIRLLLIGAAGAVLGLAGLFLSGLVNVSATVQPFALTDWMWHVGVRQSVTLRSLGVAVPPLDDSGMVRRAAGHYELVCAACHGSPAALPASFAKHLLPRPPLLTPRMERWRPPARVYWTVKHGIRHSAMPAWPDQLRDDEVWDMVAFLRALPELSANDYRSLSGRGIADTCSRCHGEDGQGGGGGLPRLDIQSPEYLAASLRAFRDGGRSSGIMRSVVANLDDGGIDSLARRYGRSVAVGTAADAPGAEIARRGIPDRKVPACESCHGAAARPAYPRLAGQDAAYLAQQLRLFRDHGAARGGPHAAIMAEAAHNLTDEDIARVSAWYAGEGVASGGP